MYTAIVALTLALRLFVPDIPNQDTRTARELLNLKGNVRSYRKKSTSPVQGIRVANRSFPYEPSFPQEYLITFSEQGEILRREDYQGSSIAKETVNEYDSEGRIVKSTVSYPSKNTSTPSIPNASAIVTRIESPPTVTTYSYSNGKLHNVQVCNTSTNQLITTTTLSYYSNGKLKELETNNVSHPKNYLIIRKEYNKQGLCVYSKSSSEIVKSSYDKNGNLLEERAYNADDNKLLHKYTYTYRSDGKKLSEKTTYNDSDSMVSIYLYNNDGLLSEICQTTEQPEYQYWHREIYQYTYNEEGMEIESVVLYEDKEGVRTLHFEQCFDSETGVITQKQDGKVVRQEVQKVEGDSFIQSFEEYRNDVLTRKGRSVSHSSLISLFVEFENTDYAYPDHPQTVKNLWQYDSQGNLTKEERYVNDRLESTYEYEIEYYI